MESVKDPQIKLALVLAEWPDYQTGFSSSQISIPSATANCSMLSIETFRSARSTEPMYVR